MTKEIKISGVFEGDLGQYRIVKTRDGSTSLYSEAFDEACHSIDGAREETLHNYIKGCQIIEKAVDCWREKRPLQILEIGLGPGFGVVVTFQVLQNWFRKQSLLDKNKKFQVHFITTEIDKSLIDYNRNFWKEQWPTKENTLLNFDFNLTVLLGDARQTLPHFCHCHPNISIEAIYQDPFSPRKNPALWTVEWFTDLKNISSKQVTLTTYSAHPGIRKAMLYADWKIERMPGFADKRSATRGFLNHPSDLSLVDQLKQSEIPAFIDAPPLS